MDVTQMIEYWGERPVAEGSDGPETRLGLQERRPMSEPNTRTPEETVADYLRDTPAGRRGINLGCGGMTFKDWLNIDSEYPHHCDIIWDLTKGLPFLPEGQFDAVFSEHFFEHITRKAAMTLLQDCFRALKPGGHLRIAIPDLDLLIYAYLQNSKDLATSETFREEYGAVFDTRCEFFNIATRGWGHTYMYNHEEIEALLRHVGFGRVKRAVVRQSDVPLLHNRESRPAQESSLIVEGRKPG
jgi:predicted SAM-dependent methyltransferase